MASPIKLFISYSHKDEALREELGDHLSNLKRQKIIDAWHDRIIVPGQEWADQIDEALESAQIVLLLISARFMASDYCHDKEMLHALARHDAGEAVVIPIILYDCDWENAPFSKLQALPKNAEPITSRTWTNHDQAWTDVVRGIRRAVAQLQKEEVPHAPSAPSPNSHRLHQRCDRTAQTDAFEDALHRHRAIQPHRPLVCLVHGDEAECHDLLVDRLKGEILPDLLKVPINECIWNDAPNPKEGVDKFWLALGKRFLNQRFESATEISQQIHQEVTRLGSPLLLRLQWYSEQFGHDQANGLANFLRFWESWPPLPENRLVICTLSLVYAEAKDARSWLALLRKSPTVRLKEWVKNLADPEQPAPSFSLAVLPELTPVEHHEAKRWCDELDPQRRDYVKEAVIEFFQHRQNRALDMRTLVKELKKLLANKELSA